MCVFDFSGCGNSEGQWVTLGHKECEDLKAVVEYVQEHKRVSKVGLWGRSMGAAASLLYMAKNPGAASAVALDSGFSDLTNVI